MEFTPLDVAGLSFILVVTLLALVLTVIESLRRK